MKRYAALIPLDFLSYFFLLSLSVPFGVLCIIVDLLCVI